MQHKHRTTQHFPLLLAGRLLIKQQLKITLMELLSNTNHRDLT